MLLVVVSSDWTVQHQLGQIVFRISYATVPHYGRGGVISVKVHRGSNSTLISAFSRGGVYCSRDGIGSFDVPPGLSIVFSLVIGFKFGLPRLYFHGKSTNGTSFCISAQREYSIPPATVKT